MTRRIVAIGEAMVEFSRRDDGTWRQGFAGDTLNVAWALRALAPAGTEVSYLTRVGEDGFSAALLEMLDRAGIATAAIRRDTARQIGLYTIATDAAGERSFTYWRAQSAARRLADDPRALSAAIEGADLVYLSGITLAILPPEGRRTLIDALAAHPVRVAFDPNIRPALWEDADAMRAAIREGAGQADIVLPTFDDEAHAFADPNAAATLARYRALGTDEVIVKDGTRPAHFAADGETGQPPVPRPVQAVDTSGAGDAFNGAYLAARIDGRPVAAAIADAQAVSAAVVGHPGALVAMDRLAEAARTRTVSPE